MNVPFSFYFFFSFSSSLSTRSISSVPELPLCTDNAIVYPLYPPFPHTAPSPLLPGPTRFEVTSLRSPVHVSHIAFSPHLSPTAQHRPMQEDNRDLSLFLSSLRIAFLAFSFPADVLPILPSDPIVALS
ncbi:hypothetical protein B0J11DRAFT_54297 [Dendryphion nanum]|uniref:Uncharacterized protein n=1 Tax=Dendryphion nanum TaxID=256645 RepID=A0A9P9DKR2_9PLEO|nr:hypothetical protein B0J11DRAFT_54297 [Dendryphion nanum]